MWVKSTWMKRSEGHRWKLLSRLPWCNFSVPKVQLHGMRKTGLTRERSNHFLLCCVLSFPAVMMTLICPDILPRDTHQLRWVILVPAIPPMSANSRMARNSLEWPCAAKKGYTRNLPVVLDAVSLKRAMAETESCFFLAQWSSWLHPHICRGTDTDLPVGCFHSYLLLHSKFF